MADNLMLGLVHLHKHGFDGWHWLYDSHLLVQHLEVGGSEFCAEFVLRCRCQGVNPSARDVLDLAEMVLGTPVPDHVLLELEPKSTGFISRWLPFTVSSEFTWNSQSLPVLLANSYLVGDGKRKRDVLWSSFWPSKEFLGSYYAKGHSLPWWKHAWCLLLHWLRPLIPAALTRPHCGKR